MYVENPFKVHQTVEITRSSQRWREKPCYIRTMRYTAIKIKNEWLIHTAQINFTDTLLREVAFEKLQVGQSNTYDIRENAADQRLPGVKGEGFPARGHRRGAVGLPAPQSWTRDTECGQWALKQSLVCTHCGRQFTERKMRLVHSRNAWLIFNVEKKLRSSIR